MKIRPACHDDIESIIALDTRHFGVSKPEYWHATLRRSEQDRGHCMLVADDGGAIAGFAVGEIRAWEFDSEPCGWVVVLTVPPHLREHRIGTRLFEALRSHFVARGVRKIRTMVARDYHLVLSFFRSQGMKAGPYIELEMDADEDRADDAGPERDASE